LAGHNRPVTFWGQILTAPAPIETAIAFAVRYLTTNAVLNMHRIRTPFTLRYRRVNVERNSAMSEEFSSSTVSDTEFDIVDELKATADDLEKELKASGNKKITEKISYLKFLVNELDDTLSGKFEALRRKRFITKKTG
jgi:hypothetical protein